MVEPLLPAASNVQNVSQNSSLENNSILNVESSRPLESNTVVFTPQMITPVPYDNANFAPICIDGVSVPDSLLKLASYSPSFAPTPTKYQPPDGNVLHDEMMEMVRGVLKSVKRSHM